MKKVLFITYYWPPSGKASLHWPLKVIKYLPQYNWQPFVLTVEEDTFSQQDNSLTGEVSPDLKVIRAKTYEPFNFYKKFTGKKENDQLIASETISKSNKSLAHKISIWLRMNLFIPDARIGWYFPAVKKGNKLIKDEKVDAIVSVGPPHTTQLIGKKLSKKNNIPHVPVFIDPWVDISYYRNFRRNKLTLSIDNRLEKSVLENAAAIVFVTKTMSEDYEKKYPAIKIKAHVLYWGYSEEDFESISGDGKTGDGRGGDERRGDGRQGEEKVIVHAGNIFDYQNPKRFWETLKNEIDKGRKLKLVFIGTVAPNIRHSITNTGLDPFTEYKGFLPYKEMLNEMMNATYLLVCATEPRHVPGKLFEYLRAGKPIIAFGDGNEEVKKILTESNAGMMFGYNESGEEFFKQSVSFSTNLEMVKRFERKKVANELSQILNKIIV